MKYRKHTAAIVTMLSVIAGVRVHAEEPINVGSDKQLFLDELFFATSKDITLKIQPPRKTGEAILRREHPWESATLNWFNVVQDRGRIDRSAKYRMWYEAYDVDGWPTADDTSWLGCPSGFYRTDTDCPAYRVRYKSLNWAAEDAIRAAAAFSLR